MKVIICGAGQVGSNIARYLSEDKADVTIIDTNADLVSSAAESLDVRGIVGFASHPNILAKAGADGADMVIAVTHADEVNMVACQVAHSLFDVPTRIARVRHQTYLDPAWGDLFSRDHMPIDMIISPEQEVALAISRRLSLPGAFENIPFCDDKVQLVGVRCTADTPVVDTPFNQLDALFPGLAMTVVLIRRNGESIVPSRDDQMLIDDEVYFAVDSSQVDRALKAFGHEEVEGRRVVIVGGGNIGRALAHLIEVEHPGVNPKIIEINEKVARRASEDLDRTIVLQGNAMEAQILEDANIANTETIVAVTNDDEANILVSMLAKRHGAQRAVTLINNSSLGTLIGQLGIETVVSPRAITVSSVLQYVRQGKVRAVHSLGSEIGELVEVDALETSAVVGKSIAEARLPNGIVFGAILRGEEVIVPRSDTTVEVGDRVLMFVASGQARKAEKLFKVGLSFF